MPAPNRNDIYEAVIRKMVMQALEEQEREFAREHSMDSDEALLAYIRESAEELGYSPRYKEIIGWKLLEYRFGEWNSALQSAGLSPSVKYPITKLPRILEETEKQKEIYRQKKAEKKRKNIMRMREQERRKKEYEKK